MEGCLICVLTLMDEQGGPVDEGLLAVRALELPLLGVDKPVFCKVTGRSETLLALVTDIGFLSCMNALVTFEAGGELEGLAAVRAFVRHVGRVGLHVRLEVAEPPEAGLTLQAVERAHILVNGLVVVEGLSCQERLPARCATVGHLPRVLPHVKLHRVLLSEPPVTVRARKGLLSCVR